MLLNDETAAQAFIDITDRPMGGRMVETLNKGGRYPSDELAPLRIIQTIIA